ncbi:MAG TPA: ChaN family lipoprotein [Syntrophobacteraceae bacterium]|nr:ChaN family lipoprotein [Syntrophobacteraceae bacterium]
MSNLSSLAGFVVAGMLLSLLLGCAGRDLRPGQAETAGGPIRPGDIVEARSGMRISAESLSDRLAQVQIVYGGETHTSPADHRVQLEILRSLHAKNPRLVLAMEMFPREVQPVLDRFSRGLIALEDFPGEVGWETVWGFPFPLYRDLLEFAQHHGLQVLGLNAPHAVVQKVARSGLASLSPEERARIAREFRPENPRHREYVRKEFDDHVKETIKDFQTFYEAQLTWEETMAETLADHLRSAPPGEQVVVIVGRGHLHYKLGIPRLVAERLAHSFKTVIPLPVDHAEGSSDRELGDYYWITEKTEPAHRGRLGILIRPDSSGEGVEVVSVIAESPAAKAGFRKGDIIVGVNDVVVKTPQDLHRAMAHKGKIHAVSVKRNGGEETMVVDLSP